MFFVSAWKTLQQEAGTLLLTIPHGPPSVLFYPLHRVCKEYAAHLPRRFLYVNKKIWRAHMTLVAADASEGYLHRFVL